MYTLKQWYTVLGRFLTGKSNENIYFKVVANCDKNIVSYAQKLVLQNKVQQTRNFLLFFFFYKLLLSIIIPGLPDR